MNALSLNPISPTSLAALASTRPGPALTTPPTSQGVSAAATSGPLQDLAQTLFLRALQSAARLPLADSAAGTGGILQDATASLLASLTTPPASTDTPAVPAAAPAPGGTQAAGTATGSTAPPSAPPVAALTDQASPQDAFATSLNPDFAAQTALRFGAGVGAQAALAASSADFGAGLIRDATRVLRTESLQTRSGGPGPEAFTQNQTTLQRVLRSYESTAALPAGQGHGAVDLLA